MQPSSPKHIISVDWRLLLKRLRKRFGLLFNSAKHRASKTEYTPPTWLSGFKLTWFRLGLIGLLLYVFTQKQIDFNISVGKEGLRTGQAIATTTASAFGQIQEQTNSHQMGLMSVSNGSSPASTNASWSIDQLDPVAVQAYIDRFERVALTEADKFGIPVAGKLAMGIYESKAGTSPVSLENNNHFGEATPNGYYPNAWTNWRAHSEYLNSEFPELTNMALDIDRWLANLDRSSYSSTSDYAARLRAIIDRFGLR